MTRHLLSFLAVTGLALASLALAQQHSRERGSTDSPTASRGIELVQPANQAASYRALWAVIIGIDKYPPNLGSLKFAVNDARGLQKVLREEFGFRADNVWFGENIRRDDVRYAFDDWLLRKKVQEDDGILVFFAGHGAADEAGNGYVAAIDAGKNLQDSWVAVSWLKDQLAKLPCRHKLLILDSCYSGALFQPMRVAGPSGMRRSSAPAGSRGGQSESASSGLADANLAYYFRRPAFLGMSAGRYQPVADGQGENCHSRFTAALLQQLRERADSTRPNQVFLFKELAVRVQQQVENQWGSRQVPNWGHLQAGDGDFIFRTTLRRATPTEQERYFQAIASAETDWQAGRATQARELLDDEKSCPRDLRDWEWRYLQYRCGSSPVHLLRATQVRAIAFRDNGTLLGVTDNAEQPLMRWRIDKDALERLSMPGARGLASCVCFDGEGRHVALAFKDRVLVWQVDSAKEVIRVDIPNVHSLALAPDGERLACSNGKLVRIVDLHPGGLRRSQDLSIHDGSLMAFSAGGKRLAVSIGNGVEVRTLGAGPNPEPVQLEQADSVSALAFSADGKTLVAADHQGIVTVWECETGWKTTSYSQSKRIHCLAVWGKGRHFLVALAMDHTVRLWDPGSGEAFSLGDHDKEIISLAFSADGMRLASASRDDTVKIWSTSGDRMVRNLLGALHCTCLAFDDRQTWLAAAYASAREGIWVWDLSKTEPTPAFTLPGERCVAFRPKQSQIVTVQGGSLVTYDVTGACDEKAVRKTRRVWPTSQGEVHAIAFSPNGEAVATAGKDGTVRVWSVRNQEAHDSTGREGLRVHRGSVTCLAWSRHWLVSGGDDGRVNLRQADSWALGRSFALTGAIRHVAASNDGQWIAACGVDGGLGIWKAESGELVEPQRKGDKVSWVTFTPDSKRLVVVGESCADLWDLSTGRKVLTLYQSSFPMTVLVFSADATGFAAANNRNILRVWTRIP